MTSTIFTGTIPALMTPCKADRTPDFDALVAKGAVRGGFPVKVLGDGDITVAVTVKGAKASASAKAKIEAAGGSVSEN